SSATGRTRASPNSPRRPRAPPAHRARYPAPTKRPGHAWATTSPRSFCSTRAPTPPGPEPNSAGSRPTPASSTSSAKAATARHKVADTAVPPDAANWKARVGVHMNVLSQVQLNVLTRLVGGPFVAGGYWAVLTGRGVDDGRMPTQ